MMKFFRHHVTGLVLACVLLPHAAEAKVTKFIVEERVLLEAGKTWGTAGAYELLRGTVYLEVDPKDPLNAVIVNLEKAPRNAKGKVELSTRFRIMKPVDVRRGNQKIWYGINNRGLVASRVEPDDAMLNQGFVVVDA